MGTPSNPGWATGYAPTAAEWEAAFSSKADYPVPFGQGGTGLTTTPASGTILIGTGSGFALATLTAGQGISIDSESGAITITNLAGTPADAFNSYGLQWAIWFNGTPAASELLALYTSPISYAYPANFVGSFAGVPAANPAAPFQLAIQQQTSGSSTWSAIGTINISESGVTTFSTTTDAQVNISAGDTLRILGPATADTAIEGYSATLKGIIPS